MNLLDASRSRVIRNLIIAILALQVVRRVTAAVKG